MSERRSGEYIADWLRRAGAEERAAETERLLLSCGPCGQPERFCWLGFGTMSKCPNMCSGNKCGYIPEV